MSNVRRWSQRWRLGFLAASCLLATTLTVAQAPTAPVRPLVEVRTTMGNMIVALYNETPQHRDNFLKLARSGAYDSLLFHRVIPGFMAQTGDPDSKHAGPETPLGQGDPGYTLPAEVVPGFIHKRGALAAARLPDDQNPERRSSGSQFYMVQGRQYQPEELTRVMERNARYGTPVNYTEEQRRTYATIGGAPHLDGAYTVFGEVVEGIEVLDAICNAMCDGRDRPLKDIRIFVRPRP